MLRKREVQFSNTFLSRNLITVKMFYYFYLFPEKYNISHVLWEWRKQTEMFFDYKITEDSRKLDLPLIPPLETTIMKIFSPLFYFPWRKCFYFYVTDASTYKCTYVHAYAHMHTNTHRCSHIVLLTRLPLTHTHLTHPLSVLTAQQGYSLI